MQASKGNKASWGWTSILEGRDLLAKNLLWKVSNGEKVRIFEDKWIPGIEGYCLKERSLTEEMKALKLKEIMVDAKWNFEKVREVLTQEEMEMIQGVRIPLLREEDKYVWLGSRDGVYSVKMGYKAAREEEEKGESGGPSSSHRASKGLWKSLWKTEVPPKVNQFLWRAASGALATKAALYRRQCADSPRCCICKTQVETIEHALFLCPWAKLCWFGSPLALKFDELSMDRFNQWFETWVMDKQIKDEYNVALFASICWHIWKARCSFVFEEIEVDAVLCLSKAIRLVNEYWDCVEKRKRRMSAQETFERALRWQKPAEGMVKINVDGSYCGKSRRAGIGLLGRDMNGRFLGGVGLDVEASSAFMAECMALLEALRIKELFADSNIFVEIDCQELFRRIRDRDIAGCDWRCEDILKKCEQGRSRCNWPMSLVSRKGNNAADY